MGLHLPKIRFDSHTLGNLVKNVAPVAGTLVGGPLGLAVAGGLGVAGEAGRGHTKFSQLAKAGLSNAALAGAGEAGAGHFGFHGIGAGTPPIPSATTSVSQNLDGSYASPVTNAATSAVDEGPGTLGKIGSGIGKVGGWVGDHDKTSAAVLGGLGNLGTAGSQNRLLNAQADIASQTAQQNAYEQKRREAQDLALEPLRQALYGKLGQNLGYAGA
jgi:hypothetical protein